MDFGKFAKAFAPVIAIAIAATVSGCDGANISINGEEGKRLSELDLSDAAPTDLVVLGPDEVRVTTGEKLAITLEGDAAAQDLVRFTLKDGTLAVLRANRKIGSADNPAIVKVTMPAPGEVTMAGSGKIFLAALGKSATVNVAGSGLVEATAIASDSLDVTIAGSGAFRGAGSTSKLKLDVLGSGSAALDALKADKADVTIAGSGNTAFSSDGEVDANIMGSGEVKVKGRARCTVSSMGSGRLVCEAGVTQKDKSAKKEG